MKVFVDTANLDELAEALQRGFPRGVTTNPALLAREQRGDFHAHVNAMIALLREYECDIPLSVPVLTADADDMVRQAEEFLDHFGHYQNLNIKVPISWDALRAIAEMRRRGIAVNCTCCMAHNQAVMAAQAGARYVSLFWGRIRDIGYDAAAVVRQVAHSLARSGEKTQLIIGSIRHIADVNDAIQAGADIVTVPPRLLPLMCAHPKTDEAVVQLLGDYAPERDGAEFTQVM